LLGLGCTALTRAAICAGAERLLMMNAFAQQNAPNTGYRALVCVFMFGGNDANNVVMPYDNYADYAAVRGGTGIQIPSADLLQVSPPSPGATFGLHPALGNQFNGSSLYDLWQAGRVAVVTNVGTLIRPVTRDEYRAGAAHPYQLFSHSDQQNEWQTAFAQSPFPTGWAGRTADYFGIDPSGFPTIASLAGVTIFSSGRSTRPIVLPDAGTPLANTLRLKRASDSEEGSALRDLLTQDTGNNGAPTLVKDDASITSQAILNSLALQQNPVEVTTTFPNTGLGRQLHQVARLIKLAPILGLSRQIFFCSIGGFDTHNSQNPGGPLGFNQGQPGLLNQVSQAIAAFYQATVELGVSSQVTTFTESDFSRTFKPGGNGAGTGTDHAWGSHHFVVGDAVNGGDFYGAYPNLVLGDADDTDAGSTARGRWIPTTAVDQYAATLAQWLGVAPGDISTVFPNIGSFATADLGFLNSAAGAARARKVRKS
jgi:uncharacterized protein (DUF1501 family)